MSMTGFSGSDDVLACFAAGNAFSWDDWFREETEEAHFQEVIDMMLNLAVFVYIGAIIVSHPTPFVREARFNPAYIALARIWQCSAGFEPLATGGDCYPHPPVPTPAHRYCAQARDASVENVPRGCFLGLVWPNGCRRCFSVNDCQGEP